MKKNLTVLSLVALFAGVSLAFAGGARTFGAPTTAKGESAQSWQYAGVDYATASASTNNIMLFTGEGVIVGFVASSNTAASDYVAFRTTNSVVGAEVTDEVARVFLSTVSYTVTNAQYGTTYLFPAPIHVTKGAAARMSVNTVTLITYLFHKFEGR